MKFSALVILAIWAAPAVAAPTSTPPVVAPTPSKPHAVVKPLAATDIINTDGKLIFSDSSSYFIFKKDGTFKSFPLGFSGRTIVGTWKADEFVFEIQGVWGWINGTSPLDDHRKMTVCIYPRATFKTNDNLPWSEEDKSVKIYDCYFEIEELVKIPKATSAKPSDK